MSIAARLPVVLAALTVTFSSGTALAAGSASVQVQFVKASMQPGTVDPALKDKFSKFNFKSVEVVGTQQVAVSSHDTSVAMPNGKQLTMALVKSSKGTANIRYEVPGMVKGTTALSTKGFTLGGKMPYADGELFVILKLLQVQ